MIAFGLGLGVGSILSFNVVGIAAGAPIINMDSNFEMCFIYNNIFLYSLVYSNYKPAHPIVVGIRLQYSATSSPATQAKHSAVSALQHGSTFWLTFSFLSKILIFFEGADTSKIFEL